MITATVSVSISSEAVESLAIYRPVSYKWLFAAPEVISLQVTSIMSKVEIMPERIVKNGAKLPKEGLVPTLRDRVFEAS
ncbi:hypothetical protein CSA37_11240 [Candidatus Fermentibacteria bacterium]|nr:MAG: hypothetical protein CSA37_11240 [Candidatus Fermentibacteria bacterium]